MAEHTAEYYQHRLGVVEKELKSYRDFSHYQVGTAGYSRSVEQLRAELEQYKTIADTLFFELKLYCKHETRGMREYKKACCG